MKSLLRAFVPALICSGPLFIAISGQVRVPTTHEELMFTYMGYGGALALTIGLAVMFRDLERLKKEIQQLRQLVENHQSR